MRHNLPGIFLKVDDKTIVFCICMPTVGLGATVVCCVSDRIDAFHQSVLIEFSLGRENKVSTKPIIEARSQHICASTFRRKMYYVQKWKHHKYAITSPNIKLAWRTVPPWFEADNLCTEAVVRERSDEAVHCNTCSFRFACDSAAPNVSGGQGTQNKHQDKYAVHIFCLGSQV